MATIRGVHLVVPPDPAHQMTVAWSRGANAYAGDATVSAHPTDGPKRAKTVTTHATYRSVLGSGRDHATVQLTGLCPDTRYRYTIIDGEDSFQSVFRTAPVAPRTVVLTAFGDQGVGSQAAAANRLITGLGSDVHLHAGDMAYSNESGSPRGPVDPHLWDAWLDQIEPDAARVPLAPAAGNHDRDPGYGPHGYDGLLSRIPLPSDDSRVPTAYAFRYGGVGIVVADTNDVAAEYPGYAGSFLGHQQRWLDQTLGRLRPFVDRLLVLCHNGPYATDIMHGSDGGVRDQFVPIFERHQVDLVLSGHNHSYERTAPMRGGVERPDGTTYLTVGCGGRSTYWEPRTESSRFQFPQTVVNLPDGARTEGAPWSMVRVAMDGIVRLRHDPDVGSGDRLSVDARTLDGQIVDAFTLSAEQTLLDVKRASAPEPLSPAQSSTHHPL